MKKARLILVFIVVFSSLPVVAQNYGYPGYGTNNNMNNQRNDQTTKFDEDRRKERMEKEKEKFVEGYVLKLKSELKLDELQYIAVKQIIDESIRSQSIIEKKEEDIENKTKAIAALGVTTETKIKALLSKEQIEKYTYLKENPPKKTK